MTSPSQGGFLEGYMSDEPPHPKLRGNRHSFMRGHASTLELSHLEMEGDDGGAMGADDMSDGHSGAYPLTPTYFGLDTPHAPSPRGIWSKGRWAMGQLGRHSGVRRAWIATHWETKAHVVAERMTSPSLHRVLLRSTVPHPLLIMLSL